MTPFELAQELRACLCDRLATTISGPVCKCTVYPSAVPPADVCDRTAEGDGQATIVINRLFDSTSFPTPDVAPVRCAGFLALEVVQTVYRCAPTMTEGQLPDSVVLEMASLALAEDAHAMRCAITCCVSANQAVLGEWEIQPLLGGCMGGRLVSVVALPQQSCADIES